MPIYSSPWKDHGSHRIYFLEIESIALREDIASGKGATVVAQPPGLARRAGAYPVRRLCAPSRDVLSRTSFTKAYAPDYVFPGPGTIAFQSDEHETASPSSICHRCRKTRSKSTTIRRGGRAFFRLRSA